MEDDAEDNIDNKSGDSKYNKIYMDYTVETGRAGLVIGRGCMSIRAIQTKANTEIESPP